MGILQRFRPTRDRATNPASASDGQVIIDAARLGLEPYVDTFSTEAAGDSGEDSASAFDRLFAYAVLLHGADEASWRSFAAFTVRESIPRRDAQNEALFDIQAQAEGWLHRLQRAEDSWASAEWGRHVASLPDDWFAFNLGRGKRTIADGVRENCVAQLAYGAVALVSLGLVDDHLVTTLYTPVAPIAPIESVLALATR